MFSAGLSGVAGTGGYGVAGKRERKEDQGWGGQQDTGRQVKYSEDTQLQILTQLWGLQLSEPQLPHL